MGTRTARSQLYKPSQSEIGWHALVDQNFDGIDTIYNVEASQFGAIEDDYFTDGVSNASTTFTSATANFTAADAGKTIKILRGGASSAQDHDTTIASWTNSTTVVLTNATGRSQTSCRFYISRGGDSTTAIQAAIDAAWVAGGGRVLCPGVGYLITGLTLRARVSLEGSGMRATMLHLGIGANKPVVAADYTLNDYATGMAVRNIWLNGSRSRQTALSSTLSAAYSVGNGTLDVTSTTGWTPMGTVLVGTNRIQYTAISVGAGTGGTDRLTGVAGGREDTTDASAISTATVTLQNSHGIFYASNPQNPSVQITDSWETQGLVENVQITNCNGDGIAVYGESEVRIHGCIILYCDQIGVRPSFDTWISNTTAGLLGRMGFYTINSSIMFSACKAWYAGGNAGANGHGFYIETTAQPATGSVVLSSCIAQDNKATGFYIKNADRITLAGCNADSNSTTSNGTYPALKIVSGNNNIIDLVCVERKQDGSNSPQQNALDIDKPSTGNNIRISHGASGAATVGTALKSGADPTGGNVILVNGAGGEATRNGPQTFTVGLTSPAVFAATAHGLQVGDAISLTTTGALPTGLATGTTYYVIPAGYTANAFEVSATANGTVINTSVSQSGVHTMTHIPDPYLATTFRYTLAANVPVVAAPVNAHAGARLRLVFQQNGTGAFTLPIPFNTIYKQITVTNTGNTANKYWIGEYEYDGTNWINLSIQQWAF